MLQSRRARRLVTAAVVAAAVGPLGAAAASAQAATIVDDTAAQFSLGTPGSMARTLTAPDGAVELSRTLEEQFTVAPAGWTSTTWADLPVESPSTVLDGALVIDGQRADSGVLAGPGSSLEFTATFGAQPSNHVGFATDFDQQPWAIFSTGSDGGGKVYARTSSGAGLAPLQANDELAGVDANVKNTYRIDWTATRVEYYVNGELRITHEIPLTTQMRPQVSDYVAGSGAVSVDSMVLSNHVASGTYTSHIFDGGDKVAGLSLKPTGVTPAGTTVAYETRTAASAAGLDGASWMPVSAGGDVTSPIAQFLQYRAAMTTTDAAATPRLDKVEIGFTVDDRAPVVAIDSIAVSGATAKVTFHSDDATATDKCNLDGGAFASCTSPTTFSDLADGSHTVGVQSTDTHLNVGSATRTFAVDTHVPVVTTPDVPPAGGSGTTPPPSGGGTLPDRTAPKVLIVRRSVRVSSGGVAKIRVSCPSTEVRCIVAMKLKLGGKTVARKTLTVRGSTARTLDLRLSRAARATLAGRSKVKVTAVITATDAAANHKTTQLRMFLSAPSH